MCATKRPISKGFADSLREAFPETDPPSAEDIAEVLYPSEEWIRPALAGKHWEELPASEVGPLACNLSLLTLKAFRYYLPALLQHAYQNSDESFTWWVLAALKPNSIHGIHLAKQMSSHQKQVIGRFVQWASKQDANRREAQDCARLWALE